LTRFGVSSKIDDSGVSIGKRYARTDECGIPFAITVDFESLEDKSVTVRDLTSMKQVRMRVEEVPANISMLSLGTKTWEEILVQYPIFEAKQTE
jgi:glycyl-tRNA synthetase